MGLGEDDGANKTGYFPYKPTTNLLHGLNEVIYMLHEEWLNNVFARHARLGTAALAAVRSWGLEMLCASQGQESGFLTSVKMPEGYRADTFRSSTLNQFDISLGNVLSKMADKVFRIGHLGDLMI